MEDWRFNENGIEILKIEVPSSYIPADKRDFIKEMRLELKHPHPDHQHRRFIHRGAEFTIISTNYNAFTILLFQNIYAQLEVIGRAQISIDSVETELKIYFDLIGIHHLIDLFGQKMVLGIDGILNLSERPSDDLLKANAIGTWALGKIQK